MNCCRLGEDGREREGCRFFLFPVIGASGSRFFPRDTCTHHGKGCFVKVSSATVLFFFQRDMTTGILAPLFTLYF